MKKWAYIIDSMTPKEREDPDIMDASRIKRIAKGSGTQETDVRDLIRQFNQAKKVMKMIGGGGMKRGPLAKLAKRFRGMM